jgi:hypothetical protein
MERLPATIEMYLELAKHPETWAWKEAVVAARERGGLLPRTTIEGIIPESPGPKHDPMRGV